jgi:hypothetical protein
MLLWPRWQEWRSQALQQSQVLRLWALQWLARLSHKRQWQATQWPMLRQ